MNDLKFNYDLFKYCMTGGEKNTNKIKKDYYDVDIFKVDKNNNEIINEMSNEEYKHELVNLMKNIDELD